MLLSRSKARSTTNIRVAMLLVVILLFANRSKTVYIDSVNVTRAAFPDMALPLLFISCGKPTFNRGRAFIESATGRHTWNGRNLCLVTG